jgi:hypothetical protein
MFIEDPLATSMVLFNFTTVALEKGVILVFGSWICIANGAGDFHQHLVDTRKVEAYTPTSYRNMDNITDDLNEIRLSDLIGNLALTKLIFRIVACLIRRLLVSISSICVNFASTMFRCYTPTSGHIRMRVKLKPET